MERYFVVGGARVRPTVRPDVYEVHTMDAPPSALGKIERVSKGAYRWFDSRAASNERGGTYGVAPTWGVAVKRLQEAREAEVTR